VIRRFSVLLEIVILWVGTMVCVGVWAFALLVELREIKHLLGRRRHACSLQRVEEEVVITSDKEQEGIDDLV
jgi:hypothetical protein